MAQAIRRQWRNEALCILNTEALRILYFARRSMIFVLREAPMVLMRISGVEAPRMVKVLLVTRRP